MANVLKMRGIVATGLPEQLQWSDVWIPQEIQVGNPSDYLVRRTTSDLIRMVPLEGVLMC